MHTLAHLQGDYSTVDFGAEFALELGAFDEGVQRVEYPDPEGMAFFCVEHHGLESCRDSVVISFDMSFSFVVAPEAASPRPHLWQFAIGLEGVGDCGLMMHSTVRCYCMG